ncbi:VOC family protein [Cellulomonas sp. IC4_254]|uniref:VOC family protein n=1 Tax=Cellulomonas sp. IC4_254 TaxID=2714040 RepID=UPI00141F3A6B|nr:VOC family protein [Cellulomonas sp. IC4_254]NHT17279.1 VOC family protein [Cellulomonas sp. IC4_254]
MTTLAVGMITFDTTDAVALATWWARHVGGTVRDEADGWFVTVDRPDGPALAFQKVADPTPGKNRVHVDLRAQDREAAVRALLADGATLVAQQTMPGFRWTVLADPDGNQFCVAQADGA